MVRHTSSKLLSVMILPAGVALAFQGSAAEAGSAASEAVAVHEVTHEVSYQNDVVPILQQHCIRCHGGTNEAGEVVVELGYNMTTYEGLMAGSDYGTVIEPGDPDGSLFIEMIVNGDMPEEGDPVPPEQIEVLRTWIAEGAQNN